MFFFHFETCPYVSSAGTPSHRPTQPVIPRELVARRHWAATPLAAALGTDDVEQHDQGNDPWRYKTNKGYSWDWDLIGKFKGSNFECEIVSLFMI